MADSGKTVEVPAGKQVTLISMEGERFQVDTRVAHMSELIKSMASDSGDEDEDGDTAHEFPLINVKRHVLAKVIDYCKHHVDEPPAPIEKPLKSSKLEEVVSEWDAKFVNVEQEMLFELILAANYMDIKPLLDLTCASVACMIRGKTPEEIRKKFNIENDFTPEEEAQVREENKWCDEAGS